MQQKKHILVASHERSGTHFLINTIALNFSYSPRQVDIDQSQGVAWGNPKAAGAWFARFKDRQIPLIFKSHHTLPFMQPLLPELLADFHILYIVRDGRYVMTSFWRYLNSLAPGWGPRCSTVGEFMRAVPCGGLCQYQHQKNPTMLQRWISHIEGWSRAADQVTILTYENLQNNFSAAVDRIAESLKQSTTCLNRPGMDSPSSLPWKGVIGNWKNHFTQSDLEYFEAQTDNHAIYRYTTL
jgi:hypothetical protein